MPETLAPPEHLSDSYLEPPDSDLRERLAERIDTYDSLSPEAEHLRAHQVESVQKFVSTVEAIVLGRKPNQGMSILHPTGSGKTVEAAEIIRMVSGQDLNVLMLVPGYRALNQTTGSGDEAGVIHSFVPHVSVGEYSGKRKELGNTVTVMNYQALRSAIARGDIETINPALVICDEIHHVIDGQWAEDVMAISQGKLLLGLTATPAYSQSRNIRKLFPNVLARKTLREGIEEGILAEMHGFIYQGTSKLVISSKHGRDYSDNDIFAAVANSRENYLAAAICAGEVAQGRRGVVSCAPGYDRAHAKIMAKILQHTPVTTAEGERFIRAVYVDGETHPDSLDRIFGEYKNGQLDVLTYVDLLLESWDSPETEFGVMLRPTRSRVLAEQRLGRIVRPHLNKIATVHEILYEVVGANLPQYTHLDILSTKTKTIVQGQYYGSKKTNPDGLKGKPRTYEDPGDVPNFDVDKFVIDAGLMAAMVDFNPRSIQNIRIAAGQEAIPYDWPTLHLLANRFDITLEEAESILERNTIASRSQLINKVEHRYYSPNATSVLASELGIEPFPKGPESPMTLSDIFQYIRETSYARHLPPRVIKEHMAEAGIEPTRYLTENNQIVLAYPYAARDVPLIRTGFKREQKDDDYLGLDVINRLPKLSVVNWLARILVHPNSATSLPGRREILMGQSCLLSAIRSAKQDEPEDYEFLAKELTLANVKPNVQMERVMETQRLSFVELVMIALKAQADHEKTDKRHRRDAARV